MISLFDRNVWGVFLKEMCARKSHQTSNIKNYTLEQILLFSSKISDSKLIKKYVNTKIKIYVES
jgi:hypothetical protein